jgi:hypothetical protein
LLILMTVDAASNGETHYVRKGKNMLSDDEDE